MILHPIPTCSNSLFIHTCLKGTSAGKSREACFSSMLEEKVNKTSSDMDSFYAHYFSSLSYLYPPLSTQSLTHSPLDGSDSNT